MAMVTVMDRKKKAKTQKNKSVSISKKENPILDNKSKENIFKKIKCNSINHSKKGKFIDIKNQIVKNNLLILIVLIIFHLFLLIL